MFTVYDNNKPASVEGYPELHSSWNNHKFSSYEEALRYVRKWLGQIYGGSWEGDMGVILPVGKRYDYTGFGDFIEIRKEQ